MFQQITFFLYFEQKNCYVSTYYRQLIINTMLCSKSDYGHDVTWYN